MNATLQNAKVLAPLLARDFDLAPGLVIPNERRLREEHPEDIVLIDGFRRRVPDPVFGWAVSWAKAGLPQVVLGHRLAASLMATSLERAGAADLRLPWPAFCIIVPDGLVVAPSVANDEMQAFTCVHVTGRSNGDVGILATSDGGCVWSSPTRPLADLGELASLETCPTEVGFSPLESRDKRALACVDRLVLGICAELSSPLARRRIAEHGRGLRAVGAREDEEPRVWTYQLTRNVRVDCRDAVRAYVQGGGNRPTVQTLVRGHWRRQHFGPGNAESKWIAIEPFWRGPEDAPIAARKHRLQEAVK